MYIAVPLIRNDGGPPKSARGRPLELRREA